MDDILASIRKIISEDPASLGLGAPAAPSPTPLSMDAHRAPVVAGAAVSRLTVQDAAMPTPRTAADGDDLSDLIEGSTAPAAPASAEPAPAVAEPLGASLGALAAGLATLVKAPPQQPHGPSTQARSTPFAAPSAVVPAASPTAIAEAHEVPMSIDDGAPLAPQPSTQASLRTLEEAVADMLRPMLQRWVDENVPALAERIVREHVRRRSDDA